jgi:hypothetical protein
MTRDNVQQAIVSSFCLLFEPESFRMMLQKNDVAFFISLVVSITSVASKLLGSEEKGQQKQLIKYVSCISGTILACSCTMYVCIQLVR